MSGIEADPAAIDVDLVSAPPADIDLPPPPPKSTVVFLPKPTAVRKNSSSSVSSASSSEEESEANVRLTTGTVDLTSDAPVVGAAAETEVEKEYAPVEAALFEQSDTVADDVSKEELLDQNLEKMRSEWKEKSPSPQSAAFGKLDGANREEKLKEIRASLEPFEIGPNDSEVTLEYQEGTSNLAEEQKTVGEQPVKGDVEELPAAPAELSEDWSKAPDVVATSEGMRDLHHEKESHEAVHESNIHAVPEFGDELNAPHERSAIHKEPETLGQVESSEADEGNTELPVHIVEPTPAPPQEQEDHQTALQVESNRVVESTMESPVEVREFVPAPPQEQRDEQFSSPPVEIAPLHQEEREIKEDRPFTLIEIVPAPAKEQPIADKVEKIAAPALLPELPKKPAPKLLLRQNERPIDVIAEAKFKPQPEPQIKKQEEVHIFTSADTAEVKSVSNTTVKKTDEPAQSSSVDVDASGAKKADEKPATHKKRKCTIL
uniref:Uncharacterized protein n=1 Tax=Plectus sambesii TaxID=2011161 RepID=A0A914WK19_9BILA